MLAGTRLVSRFVLENNWEQSDINTVSSTHVETVVLLVRKTPDAYVRIKMDMEDFDITKSESKATYEEIKAYVKEQTGLNVTHLDIAQTKRKSGIIERGNYNLPKSADAKQPQCTKEKEEAILDALKHFQMISQS